MWAWHRIDGLLKAADAKGNRAPVIDEIVRLGEGYSIASEYTSFLVLENDAEYQRWKIARTNMRRIDNDRKALASVERGFEKMRNKALANLGPEAVGAPAQNVSGRSAPAMQVANLPPSAQAPQEVRPSGGNVRFNTGGGGGGGGGPVGPIFVLFALLWKKATGQKEA
jgi:Ca-activated chloride channel family protein